MRKLLLVLGIVVAAAIGFSMSTLKAKVRRATDEFVAAVGEAHDAKVEVGSIGIALLPRPSVRLRDVRLLAGPRPRRLGRDVEPAPLIAAPVVRVEPKILPLLTGRARVKSVRILSPVVTLGGDYSDAKTRLLPLLTFDGGEAPEFDVAVDDARVVVEQEDANGDPEAWLELSGVAMTVARAADGEGLIYEIERALPAGEGSDLHGQVRHVAGVGPTGGDRLEVDLVLEGGDPNRLVTLPERLSRAKLIAPLELVVKASGFVGERSTEVVPAEPLEGSLEGQVGLEVFGVEHPLTFDLVTAIDDKRYLVREGEVHWGELPLDLTGWIARAKDAKIGWRLSWERVDSDAFLSAFGVDERWRPRAKCSGEVRLMGELERPLVRYEASAPSVKLVPWPSLPIVSGEMHVTGSLLAINADVSGSFDTSDLRIADARLPEALFGIQYWRDKLTFSSLNQDAWGGRADVSFAYRPNEDNDVEGGGILSHMNAKETIENLFPTLGLAIEGSLDSLFQVGLDANGPWAMGRVGIHHGKMGDTGLVRSVLDTAFARADRTFEVDDALNRSYPGALAAERTEFQRLAFDFKTAEDGVDVKSVEIRLPYATVYGQGVLDHEGAIAGWGSVSLSEPLTADVVRRTKGLRGLVADDGRLHVPVRIQGKAGSEPGPLEVTPEDRFVEALARALRGEKVEPFAPPADESELTMDLPSLADHFMR